MVNLILSLAVLLPNSLSHPKTPKDFWAEVQAVAKLEDKILRTSAFFVTKATKVFLDGKRVESMEHIPDGSSIEHLIYDKETKEVNSIYFLSPKDE